MHTGGQMPSKLEITKVNIRDLLGVSAFLPVHICPPDFPVSVIAILPLHSVGNKHFSH